MAKAPEAPDPSYWHPELLAAPLRSKRLTVLYGPPGPWRDGMVRRGLMPLLRQPPPLVQTRGRTRRRQVPIRFDGWGPLPLQALRTRIDAEFSAVWPQGPPDTLAAHLRAIGRHHHATVLLVLDAFERHLHERAERHDIERFPRVQDFASYARLVKCAHESAGRRSGTGGAKIGNAHLRWAFAEAVLLLLREREDLQRLRQRLERKHGKGKSLAILAHKLGRAVYFMLKRKRTFQMDRFLAA